jgi:glycosyltransferase involved in cell wall biosynthesis
MRAVIVASHPIQYQAPLFRKLAKLVDLTVVFMMHATPKEQAASGFGVEFEWDMPLLEGYAHVFANNVARAPSSSRRRGIVLRGHEVLLGSINPDVLMTMGWFPRGYLQALRWAWNKRVPTVCRGESNLLTGRSFAKRMMRRYYFSRLFSRFQSFAVIGERNRDFYRQHGVPPEKLVHAPYSVDDEFFEREFSVHRVRPRRPGPWRIGFAGKLIPKKRPVDLMSAAAAAKQRGDIEVVIIGDGPLRSAVMDVAARGGVRVDFRGFLNQSEIVARGYSDLDLLVLPSDEGETWGLVVNEVMAGGIPVIVSDRVGCAPDLVEPGSTGEIFPCADVRALSDAIDKVVGRLSAGHNFEPAVRQRIARYSLRETASGIRSAMEAAVAA